MSSITARTKPIRFETLSPKQLRILRFLAANKSWHTTEAVAEATICSTVLARDVCFRLEHNGLIEKEVVDTRGKSLYKVSRRTLSYLDEYEQYLRKTASSNGSHATIVSKNYEVIETKNTVKTVAPPQPYQPYVPKDETVYRPNSLDFTKVRSRGF